MKDDRDKIIKTIIKCFDESGSVEGIISKITTRLLYDQDLSEQLEIFLEKRETLCHKVKYDYKKLTTLLLESDDKILDIIYSYMYLFAKKIKAASATTDVHNNKLDNQNMVYNYAAWIGKNTKHIHERYEVIVSDEYKKAKESLNYFAEAIIKERSKIIEEKFSL